MNDIVENYEKYLKKKENGKEINTDKQFLLEQGFLISVNKAKEVMKNFVESHTNKYGRLYIVYIENYYERKEDKLNFFTIKASNGTLFSFKVVELDNEYYVPIEEFFKNDNIHDLPFHCNTLKCFLRWELLNDNKEIEL